MTDGEAISAAWADYFVVADAMRPMSEMTNPNDVGYLVDQSMSLHWTDWSDYHDEWIFDAEDRDAGFDETQAIGWLPA
jgi:hypothetical protein